MLNGEWKLPFEVWDNGREAGGWETALTDEYLRHEPSSSRPGPWWAVGTHWVMVLKNGPDQCANVWTFRRALSGQGDGQTTESPRLGRERGEGMLPGEMGMINTKRPGCWEGYGHHEHQGQQQSVRHLSVVPVSGSRWDRSCQVIIVSLSQPGPLLGARASARTGAHGAPGPAECGGGSQQEPS